MIVMPQQEIPVNPLELTGTLGRKAGASFSTVGAQFKVSFSSFVSILFSSLILCCHAATTQ
jgi:hypothetical protein